MRQLTTATRLREFLTRLGGSTRTPGTVYLVGGATAVMEGWRDSTVDIDLKLVPDSDELLRAIADLKQRLDVNVELASPDLFIPVDPGWSDRSPWVGRFGPLDVRHFDLTYQALAKLERGHDRDLLDVRAMVARRLVSPESIRTAYEAIEAELYRYPSLEPRAFRANVEEFLDSLSPNAPGHDAPSTDDSA
jgi:hypothetical protein